MKPKNLFKIFFVCSVALGFAMTGAGFAEEQTAPKTIGEGVSPEDVYRLFHRAKKQLDTRALALLVSRRSGLKEDGMYERLMRERSTLPEELEFVTKKSEGNIAQTLFKGTRRDRESDKIVISRGVIQFLKEDRAWRIYKETWEDVKEEDYVSSSTGSDRHQAPIVPKEHRLPRTKKNPAKGRAN